jgi:pimeloyl-ACP methyl ester carboxylesterase
MPERFIQSGSIELWTESFGNPGNPAILLIMGAGAQGIMWPDKFCQILAENNFFVIRYDNRDTGQSSSVDFSKNPYSLDDMAADAIAILDAYNIDKAHIVGASMGGRIAQLIALEYPDRVKTLTLIMSTQNLSIFMKALAGEDLSDVKLPPPSQEVVDFYRSQFAAMPKTEKEWVDSAVRSWHIFSGSQSFDEEEIRNLEKKVFSRARNINAALNHSKAVEASLTKKLNLGLIKAPTLIIHGQRDPLFPVEHGKALAKAIPGASLELIPEMGHVISTILSKKLADIIIKHIDISGR